MQLRPATFDDALFVARHLRLADADEVYARRWDDDPAKLAYDAVSVTPFVWCAVTSDNVPAVIIGAVQHCPGVWNMFMFVTNDFYKIRFSLTKAVKRGIIPALVDVGAHRLECQSSVEHTASHRWLERLGAEREATHRRYGRNKEDFYTYAMMVG